MLLAVVDDRLGLARYRDDNFGCYRINLQPAVLDLECDIREVRVIICELLGLESHLVSAGVHAACLCCAVEGEVILRVQVATFNFYIVAFNLMLLAVVDDRLGLAGDRDYYFVGYGRDRQLAWSLGNRKVLSYIITFCIHDNYAAAELTVITVDIRATCAVC